MRPLKLRFAGCLLSLVLQCATAQPADESLRCRFTPLAGSKAEVLVALAKTSSGLQSIIGDQVLNPDVKVAEDTIPDRFYDSVLDKSLDRTNLGPVRAAFAALVESNSVLSRAAVEGAKLGRGMSPAPFDLSLVRKMRTFQLDSKPTKFGSALLIEAMNESGGLMGRGVFLLFYSPCLP
jgi:hypothetical protein